MTTKPILKFAGLGLLICGTILNILMFVSEAWPTYLFFVMMGVGLLFLLASYFFKNLKNIWQIVIVLIPFITTYILFDISSASNDTFLIPKGFTGQVTIYYDRPNGQQEEYEGKWRIYRVPISGNLETKFKLKGHSINLSSSHYYYVDSNSKRQELNHYCEYCEVKDTVTLQVIYGVLGTDDKGTYQTFFIDRPFNKNRIHNRE